MMMLYIICYLRIRIGFWMNLFRVNRCCVDAMEIQYGVGERPSI